MPRKLPQFKNWPTGLDVAFGPFRAISMIDPAFDDGDSIWFFIDLGRHRYDFGSVRLMGIDAPERTGEEKPHGLASLAYVASVIPYGAPVQLHTLPDPEKYGRYLGCIIYLAGGTWRSCLNLDLVTDGHAEPKPEWGWGQVQAICMKEGIIQ